MPVLVAETWGWPPAIAMPSWPPPPAPAPRRLELVRSREARPTVVQGPSGWAAPTTPSSDNLGRGDRTSHSAQRERSRSATPVGEKKSSEGEAAAPRFVLKPTGTKRASDGRAARLERRRRAS
ncbi:hypothetical protein PVAP13_7NG024689 [Panicum virgatum]|uniref:Uncharacterized protein n=1 Tax=Panicum virgatum TaxID=38727 RepID=A0A8T0PRH0_PANVG|nr:hypothetical protein PVAP13_7NG024689 [Panicum virgatum]